LKQSNACSCQKLDRKHAFNVFATIPELLKALPQGGIAEIVASVVSGNKGVLIITVDTIEAGDGDG